MQISLGSLVTFVSLSFATASSPVYDIGVAAVHEPVEAVPQCGLTFAETHDRIEQEFALFGYNRTDTDARMLYNCNTYCRNNRYNPLECYYWTQGQCGFRRKMTEVNDDTDGVPPSVATECLRRKKILGLALKEEVAGTASLTKECQDYFGSGWEFKCMYRVVE